MYSLFLSIMVCLFVSCAYAQDTIKVGIVHSLTGTMAISEKILKDELLMLIDRQNSKGGLLGIKLEAVVVEPQSKWPLYAEKARELLEKEKVAVIFGGWTSASRKAMKPVIESHDGILFYPAQYEGQELSEHIFYLGATPNQQAIPAVEYLHKEKEIERWVLLGTDYVYPRTTNKILVAYLKSIGVDDSNILMNYTPFGHSDWERIVAEIKEFASQGKKTAVVSTVNGDANLYLYRELSAQHINSSETPVLAFSIGEPELNAIRDLDDLIGHLAAWNYFMSVDSDENHKVLREWAKYRGSSQVLFSDPMEAHYIGFNMWVQAVEKSGTIESKIVRQNLIGVQTKNLSGQLVEMLPNHHISKPVYIGEIRSDGQFNIVWQSGEMIPGDPWSDYLDNAKH